MCNIWIDPKSWHKLQALRETSKFNYNLAKCMKVCLLPGTQLTSLSEGIAWLCMVCVKSSKIWVILDVFLSSKSLDQRETIPFQVNQIHSLTNSMCDVITKIAYKNPPLPLPKTKFIAFLIKYKGIFPTRNGGATNSFPGSSFGNAPKVYPPLKLTASLHLKMDGWKMYFLLK